MGKVAQAMVSDPGLGRGVRRGTPGPTSPRRLGRGISLCNCSSEAPALPDHTPPVLPQSNEHLAIRRLLRVLGSALKPVGHKESPSPALFVHTAHTVDGETEAPGEWPPGHAQHPVCPNPQAHLPFWRYSSFPKWCL